MFHSRLFRAGLVLAATLGLVACTDGYGYGGGIGYAGGYNSDYDRYYGDPYGYRSVPYGYVGSNFGWYGDHYYPGNGGYVYDRRGHRRNWSTRQRGYWQHRARIRPDVRYQGRADRPGNFYRQPDRQRDIRADDRPGRLRGGGAANDGGGLGPARRDMQQRRHAEERQYRDTDKSDRTEERMARKREDRSGRGPN